MTRLLVCTAALLASACAHRRTVSVKVPTAMERQAVNAVDAGDGDYEVKTLRSRVDSNPLDLTARLALARRYQGLGFPEVAIEHCRLACERAPDSEEAHLALAKMLREEGRAVEAAAGLEAFSSKHVLSASGWAWLGLLQDGAGDWKAGEAAHRKALALAPVRDDLHNNLGYCLLRQGKKKEAAEEFQTALKLNPQSAFAQNNLGMLLSGTPKEAVEHLQSVSDAASAHNNLAVAYIEAGKYQDARREIDLALRYNRQHLAALNNLRLVSQLDGKPAEIERPARAEGRWAHLVSMWRQLFWGSHSPEGRNT